MRSLFDRRVHFILWLLLFSLMECTAGAEGPANIAPSLLDVRALGARGDGISDDSGPINAALRRAARDQGETYLPAGSYMIGAPLEIYGGTILRGAGEGATRIVSDTSGPGFSMIQVATPNRCRWGAGSCDARINDGARGDGCACYTGADCASAVCGGGEVQRDARVSDLQLVVRKQNMVALDAAFLGESTFTNLRIKAEGRDITRGIGVLFSDGGFDSTVSGYSNAVAFSRISDLPQCAWVMARANDQTFLRVGFGNSCGTGLLVDKNVEGTKVTNCMFQSTQAPVCAAGLCVGGMSNGARCQAPPDCLEGDLVDFGRNTTILANYFEDSRNPHIRLGAISPSRTSQQALVLGNSHSGKGAYLVEASAQRPVIVETTYETDHQRTMLGGNPLVLPSIDYRVLKAEPDGALVHCTDCRTTSPCEAGGTGAIAKRLNGMWVCN